ncbi:toxoplasma gondii family B protein [Toxoplasma gondii GT1]|uniref:Toxoplasma gondii family B protein n=1 Tax=Toxoplasma gondii (strain ATCC 50853 / GT1) TaxID=507601 RepID=S7UHD2_TOXGG|nr:toxoplasma gondii family B protein [Toxoplasma gondii GT1]
MVNLPSSAAAAFFALCFYDMGDSCIRSSAVAANASDSVTVLGGKADDSGAPFVASSAAPQGEAEQQLAHVNITSKKPRNIPNKKTTVALRRIKKANAITTFWLLTGVLGLMLVSVKLLTCRQDLLRNTGRGPEGNTVRRLAEGGDDNDKCVSSAVASTCCRQCVCH